MDTPSRYNHPDRRTIDVEGWGIQKENIENVYKAWSVFANQNNDIQNVSNFTIVNNNIALDNGVLKYSA